MKSLLKHFLIVAANQSSEISLEHDMKLEYSYLSNDGVYFYIKCDYHAGTVDINIQYKHYNDDNFKSYQHKMVVAPYDELIESNWQAFTYKFLMEIYVDKKVREGLIDLLALEYDWAI